jgi:hypothetical protein
VRILKELAVCNFQFAVIANGLLLTANSKIYLEGGNNTPSIT